MITRIVAQTISEYMALKTHHCVLCHIIPRPILTEELRGTLNIYLRIAKIPMTLESRFLNHQLGVRRKSSALNPSIISLLRLIN